MPYQCLAALLFVSCAATLASADVPAAGKQVEMTFEREGQKPISYLLYLPKAYDEEPDRAWPVILFLHGRGESYGPLSIVAKWGPPRMAESGDLPYVIISPQCPGDDRWDSEVQQQGALQLLDSVCDNYRVHKARVYLTGLSMGGKGSWMMAAQNPQRFAAVTPICGSGDPAWATELKDVPIWVFHGDQDTAVPFQRSVDMVEAIRKAGGQQIRFTTLEHVGHNSWSAAYATPELFEWFNRHSLGKSDSR